MFRTLADFDPHSKSSCALQMLLGACFIASPEVSSVSDSPSRATDCVLPLHTVASFYREIVVKWFRLCVFFVTITARGIVHFFCIFEYFLRMACVCLHASFKAQFCGETRRVPTARREGLPQLIRCRASTRALEEGSATLSLEQTKYRLHLTKTG